MIAHHVRQGSAAWRALRLGVPTASNFARIVTSDGRRSEQLPRYARDLAVEIWCGQPTRPYVSRLPWVRRGTRLEPWAARQYEFVYDVHARPAGFITTDDGRVGASPDRLVGAAGGVEFKCGCMETHLAFRRHGPAAHRAQVQGQALVADLEWVDLYAFHPELPPVCLRQYRDERFLAALRAGLSELLDRRDDLLARNHPAELLARNRVAKGCAA